jgi:hypothetical protein
VRTGRTARASSDDYGALHEGTIMNWEHGKRYRGKGVAGQIAIKENANSENRTKFVEALIEVTQGPLLTERIRWRGYLNSAKNAEVTFSELRAMGWRGQRLGDWSGIGAKEVQFTCSVDVGQNGKKYPRATWVQEPQTLRDDNAASSVDVDELNRQFGDLIRNTAAPAPNGHNPTAPGARGMPGDDYFDGGEQEEMPI